LLAKLRFNCFLVYFVLRTLHTLPSGNSAMQEISKSNNRVWFSCTSCSKYSWIEFIVFTAWRKTLQSWKTIWNSQNRRVLRIPRLF